MQQFFKDNKVRIYHTNSHFKAVVIERFNRSLRELMMKEFVKNNNTVWYNILHKLIKKYNNRYHSTIKMKPIQVINFRMRAIKDMACLKKSNFQQIKICHHQDMLGTKYVTN